MEESSCRNVIGLGLTWTPYVTLPELTFLIWPN
jgi:hypothetical protein